MSEEVKSLPDEGQASLIADHQANGLVATASRLGVEKYVLILGVNCVEDGKDTLLLSTSAHGAAADLLDMLDGARKTVLKQAWETLSARSESEKEVA